MARGLTISKVESVEKLVMSEDEAIKYLGCSKRFMRTLREKAEISFSKYGKTFFYEVKSINRFLNRHKVV
ncbi:helix-turn-helix domain-containing protein [Parabacteroides hominis]|jgi:hypothetical protein|uniref:Helix-turn-helix domain-containing protein n=1 Tax=Parabacteroides hominis TaxID=2763057 RepID=A0ABR7DLW6_9BACT|nr:helix-turn-helix domain-containing protein [Parabacteroides hominis]MBC5632075.1 helix-turn-helix domain-containing protein [Parabacteroides hominis]